MTLVYPENSPATWTSPSARAIGGGTGIKAQPPRPGGEGRWTDTTWRVRFGIDRASSGTATLRLAICGARGGPVDVSLNGRPIGTTGDLPESGVMHRDGIRFVAVTERNIAFDSSLLRAGENVLALTKRARG